MFTFKLELETGEAAEPAKFVTAVSGWAPGDRVLIRPGLAYRVVEARVISGVRHREDVEGRVKGVAVVTP